MQPLLLVPELNHWAIKIFDLSSLNESPMKLPSLISEEWRCLRSVIDLLFNENFNPPSEASSSSSEPDIESDNDKRYIYRYRSCNLNKITDRNLLNRIQIYRWWTNVMVANCNKFIDIIDQENALNPPVNQSGTAGYYGGVTGDFDQLIDSNNNNQVPPLRDVPPQPDKSPYITYTHGTYLSTNFPLVYGKNEPIPPPPQPPIIPALEDPFSFTDEEFIMLDLLYDYKTDLTVNLESIDFSTLVSPLSKLIYVYLDAMIYKSFEYYDTSEPFTSQSDGLLRCLYEKFVLQIIFRLKEIQYGVVYKPSEIINEVETEVNQDYFIILKLEIQKIELTSEIVQNRQFVITENLPWNRKDFVMFRDGVLLTQDVHYKVSIDRTDPRNIFTNVLLLGDCFVLGENLKCYWSYLVPYSAHSQQDK